MDPNKFGIFEKKRKEVKNDLQRIVRERRIQRQDGRNKRKRGEEDIKIIARIIKMIGEDEIINEILVERRFDKKSVDARRRLVPIKRTPCHRLPRETLRFSLPS